MTENFLQPSCTPLGVATRGDIATTSNNGKVSRLKQ